MNSSSTSPPNSELRCCSRSGRMNREDSRRIRRLWWPDMRVALPPLEPCSTGQADLGFGVMRHCMVCIAHAPDTDLNRGHGREHCLCVGTRAAGFKVALMRPFKGICSEA